MGKEGNGPKKQEKLTLVRRYAIDTRPPPLGAYMGCMVVTCLCFKYEMKRGEAVSQ